MLKRLLIASLCLGCVLQSCAQDLNVKGKLFIIGGGSRPASMVERIVKESGIDKEGYGIVLPMSSSEPDSSAYYATNQFYKLGVNNVYGLHFVKDEKIQRSKLDSIRNAKLIYISGGDQNRFMDVVAGTEIETIIHEAYKNGSLIAGTSAGAAVMSEMMITGNELKHPDYASTFRNIEYENIEIQTGLGLITNIIVDQHFVKRSRYNRLLSAIIEYPELVGVGIDESTAILVSGNTMEVVGESQVIVFKNPNKSKTTFEDKLGAKGINMNIYLPGETFTID
ncbi:cyanophycinase [Winogradskyella forsetii]|uniref:cyanophycinase n=1 Tax=Winogradskyella forsetii TaxID=2686077 RepID=UPI0015C1AF78|nr:cyanophycinase [Winogradskyella forsetii]